MKKRNLFLLFILSILSSCRNEEQTDMSQIEISSFNLERKCSSSEALEQRLKSSPELKNMYTKDLHEEELIEKNLESGKLINNETVVIPVIVNVVYSNPVNNVSIDRILSQEEVLNNTFASTNFDIGKIPNLFKPVKAGNIKIRFTVVDFKRRKVPAQIWQADKDLMKTEQYGIAATNPNKYLNIWVVDNLDQSSTGYSSLPFEHGRWYDGVVIRAVNFGVTNKNAMYGLGRTAVHEVGHYLGLKHIWGDTACGTDNINDTPQQKNAIYGNPNFPFYTLCGGTRRVAMTMNFMNYVDDRSMYMFTRDQGNRMEYVVSARGRRSSLRTN
ncbi:M43 family zinc metalloprotease [Chryseobacterium sp. 22532]|uniref:M43 family zinc metalloprotease n=1 Tax=Chryseobacterium sp. 22532 TaxID=3453938 RepID=UPI003F869A1F